MRKFFISFLGRNKCLGWGGFSDDNERKWTKKFWSKKKFSIFFQKIKNRFDFQNFLLYGNQDFLFMLGLLFNLMDRFFGIFSWKINLFYFTHAQSSTRSLQIDLDLENIIALCQKQKPENLTLERFYLRLIFGLRSHERSKFILIWWWFRQKGKYFFEKKKNFIR